jgi:hypothetical protein
LDNLLEQVRKAVKDYPHPVGLWTKCRILANDVMRWDDIQFELYQSVINSWKINVLHLPELIGSLSINHKLLKLPINSPDTQVWALKSYSLQPLDIHAVAVETAKFVQSPTRFLGHFTAQCPDQFHIF